MWQTLKNSLLFNIFLIFLAFLFGYSSLKMAYQTATLWQETKVLEDKLVELTRKKQNIQASLTELETREAIEREAKERLNLKKQGEEVVVVVPDKKSQSVEVPPKTFWQKAALIFKSIFGF